MAAGSGGIWRLTQIISDGTSGVIKPASGALGSAIATNNHSADQWLHLFDSATAPEASDVPRLSVPLKANGGSYTLSQVLWGDRGLAFSNGIAWGVSSTEAAFTAGNAAANLQFYWA